MKRTKPTADPNVVAHDLVKRSLLSVDSDKMPASIEEAWVAWARGIQAADERTMSLLRAAFLAGADSVSASLGRAGGLKGGAARSAALSPARRKAIAKKAAAARWGNGKAGA